MRILPDRRKLARKIRTKLTGSLSWLKRLDRLQSAPYFLYYIPSSEFNLSLPSITRIHCQLKVYLLVKWIAWWKSRAKLISTDFFSWVIVNYRDITVLLNPSENKSKFSIIFPQVFGTLTELSVSSLWLLDLLSKSFPETQFSWLLRKIHRRISENGVQTTQET